MIWGRVGVVAVGLALLSSSSSAAERVGVAWHPSKPKLGDVAWLHVRDVPEGASVEGSLDGRPLRFFPYAGGQAALIGVDLETKPGAHLWKVGVVEPGRESRNAQGSLTIARRSFPQERLTLPQTMVDLNPETEKRAVDETGQLTTLYRTVTPERLWRGPFTKPVGTPAAGTEGIYNITLTAQNGTLPNATQLFTLTVQDAVPIFRAPTITSAASTTCFMESIPPVRSEWVADKTDVR